MNTQTKTYLKAHYFQNFYSAIGVWVILLCFIFFALNAWGNVSPEFKDGKWGLKDNFSQKWVLEPQFSVIGDPSEGLRLVQMAASRKYGYIREDGSWAIEPRFDEAGDFKDGFAVVTFHSQKGIINMEGKILIQEPEYRSFTRFTRGLLLNGQWGYIIRGSGSLDLSLWRPVVFQKGKHRCWHSMERNTGI